MTADCRSASSPQLADDPKHHEGPDIKR